jgi:hypothetical protein
MIEEGDVDTTSYLVFKNKKFEPGYYKISVTAKDRYGKDVKDLRFVQLFNKNNAAYTSYNFNYTINDHAEPGKTAHFITGSMADKVFVVQQTIKGNTGSTTSASYQYSYRTKGVHQLDYTATEEDRGNTVISEAFVYNNRVYLNTYTVVVPWTNKQLDVQYATYRNKTEPGSKEQWTITVANKKGEKAAAELLTTMYDASLDQFIQQGWSIPYIWETNYARNNFNKGAGFTNSGSIENYLNNNWKSYDKQYDKLLLGISADIVSWPVMLRGINVNPNSALQGKVSGVYLADNQLNEVAIVGYGANKAKQEDADYDKVYTTVDVVTADGKHIVNGRVVNDNVSINNSSIQIRKDFSETAFFFPQLYADTSGKYSFSFTMPDAVTQWKWMSLAHTKDLAFGINTITITTQKTLMVQSNAPRFMREGDNMEFTATISNLSDKEITGQATLELVDATTNTSVDGWFQNVFPTQYFTVGAKQSSVVKFPIQIPFSYNKPLTWRVVAKSENYSDGEENILPVVTNRVLVTESLPLSIKGDTTQHFVFEKLLNNKSETLTSQLLTVEYTANPVWNAIQALPYLMEYPYECAEQIFNRLYANALAAYLVNTHPRIKQVFEEWKKDTTALQSNLQKNEELKQILLQETPWVLQAENEAQQKKNIALLFDAVKMSYNTNAAIEKLQQMQMKNGAFSWFKGGYEDRYITNYILTGIGKLKKIGALTNEMNSKLNGLIHNALNFLDDKISEDYQWLIDHKVDLKKKQIASSQIQYLYMRSFFANETLSNKKAYDYYYQQAKQYWVKENLYCQSLIGAVLFRNNERQFVADNILPSILQNAIVNEQGMYWKEPYTSFWYQSPVEFQSAMISLFSEVNQQQKITALTNKINDMKTWLLLNKQTNNWKTTIATADACYALLLNGNDLLNNNAQVNIQLGNDTIKIEKQQAGSGYFKTQINGPSITPDMGNIIVHTTSQQKSNDEKNLSYGSMYWQYFEEIDKASASSSPLSLHKKIFVERNSDKGKVLEPVNDKDELKVGDKVVIRIELKSDRDMEYVHLKDMRGACMEPVNVISSYKWQDGLGYYEATKDASTNFFISNVRKGSYVFEYPVFITHAGTFSVGIANVQCMYAPEFASHSEGIRINVVGQ